MGSITSVLASIGTDKPHHLWLDVRPELSLLWVKSLAKLCTPIVLASPPAGSKNEVEAMEALSSLHSFPILVANELAFSKGMLTIAAMRSGGRLSTLEHLSLTIALPGGRRFVDAFDDTMLHYRIVSLLSDALVVCSLLGVETTALELESPMGSSYLDALKCTAIGADDARASITILPGRSHLTTAELSSSTSDGALSWVLDTTTDTVEVIAGATKRRLSSTRMTMADVISEIERSIFSEAASGYCRLAHYGSHLHSALALVDEYLYGAVEVLNEHRVEEFRREIAQNGGVYDGLQLSVQRNVRSGFSMDADEYRAFMTTVSKPLSMLFVRVPSNPQRRGESVYPPLGIAQIAAVANEMGCRSVLSDLAVAERGGARLSGGDEDFERLATRLREVVRAGDYHLVGFSADISVDMALVEHLASAVKDEGIRWTMFGGRLVRNINWSEYPTEGTALDFIAVGEGEVAMAGLVRHLTDGLPLDRVPSVWSTRGALRPEYEVMIDFKLLPTPSFDGLDLMAYDTTSSAMQVPLLPYQFLVGCPFRCAFCSSDTGQRPRVRPVASVIDDLRTLRDRYGVYHFAFYNNMINGDRRYLKEFIRAMKEAQLGIRWSDSARLSHVDLDDIRELASIGCVELVWGLDTGSQEQSDFLHKSLDVEFSKQIVRLARDLGIKSQINFIVGMPHETEAQFRASMDYAKEFYGDARISVSDYRFNGGSPLYVTPHGFGLSKRGATFYERGGLSWIEHRHRVYSRYVEMVSEVCPQDIAYIDATFPEFELMRDADAIRAASP